MKRILLPLDGSDIAESALPYAEELASKLGAELVLYHAYSHEKHPQEHMYKTYLNSIAQIVRGKTGAGDIKVSTTIETGEAASNICNLVNQNEVDLVVMTTVSSSGLKVGKTLGSVTDHVCRNVPVPVMLIRPANAMQPEKNEQLLKRMLVTLDGSELSKLALPIAEELAAGLKLNTTLFQMSNMIRLYDDGSGISPYIVYTQFNEIEKNRVIDEMNTLQKTLQEKGLNVSSTVVSGFDAAGEIIEISKKMNIDLVVMSTHGRTGFSRWVLGNVAEKVLRHGTSHLLLIHAAAV